MSGDLERMLHDFVQGGHTLAEEDLIMQALLEYRQRVLVEGLQLTPFLLHAYDVLNSWNLARTGEAIPWHNVRDRTPYGTPSLVTSQAARPISPAGALAHRTPANLHAPASQGVSVAADRHEGVDEGKRVNREEGSNERARAEGSAGLPMGRVDGGEGDVVDVVDDGQKAKGTGKGQGKGKGKGQGKGKGKAKANAGVPEAATTTGKPASKRRKISPEDVPAHHLDDDSPMAVPQPKKTFARITVPPHQKSLPKGPDTLWLTRTERPTARCSTCELKNVICDTTGAQLACAPCHVTKTKCSYSAARALRRGPAKTSAKRKRRDEEEYVDEEGPAHGTTVNDSRETSVASYTTPRGLRQKEVLDSEERGAAKAKVDRRTTVNAIAGPSGATRPVSMAPPVPLSAGSKEAPVVQPSSDTSLPNNRTITLGGVQRGLSDLRTTVAELSSAFTIVSTENVMLRGWVETLMVLKEQMTVTVPALQAELQGLREGMELEKMRSQVTRLQDELATATGRIAELEMERNSDEDDDDEDEDPIPAAPHRAPAERHTGITVQGPRSSMYVSPADFRVHTQKASAMLATEYQEASSPSDAPVPLSPIPMTTALQSPVIRPTPATVPVVPSPLLNIAVSLAPSAASPNTGSTTMDPLPSGSSS